MTLEREGNGRGSDRLDDRGHYPTPALDAGVSGEARGASEREGNGRGRHR
jgi:hypothetical protein